MDSVPNATSGKLLNELDYPGFFSVDTVAVVQGIAKLTLGDFPVIIETGPD